MKTVVRFIAGLIVGATTGLAVGLLLAPASGNDLQNQVKARIDEALSEGKKAAATREAELQAQFAAAKKTPL